MIPAAEAERYRAHRMNGDPVLRQDPAPRTGEWGIYLVCPDPELRPRRVKPGRTQDLAARLADYRTIAPALQLLRFWPTPDLWMESMALSLLRHHAGARICGPELFDLDDLPSVLALLDAAFQAHGITHKMSAPVEVAA
jgi:hypothetical protein